MVLEKGVRHYTLWPLGLCGEQRGRSTPGNPKHEARGSKQARKGDDRNARETQNKANLSAGGLLLGLGIADWGFGAAGAPNEPNFRRFGRETGAEMENEPNWAERAVGGHGPPYGILGETPGGRGKPLSPRAGGRECQTKPISSVLGQERGWRQKTKPICVGGRRAIGDSGQSRHGMANEPNWAGRGVGGHGPPYGRGTKHRTAGLSNEAHLPRSGAKNGDRPEKQTQFRRVSPGKTGRVRESRARSQGRRAQANVAARARMARRAKESQFADTCVRAKCHERKYGRGQTARCDSRRLRRKRRGTGLSGRAARFAVEKRLAAGMGIL